MGFFFPQCLSLLFFKKTSWVRLSEHEVNGWLVSLKSLMKCQYVNEYSLNEHFLNVLKTITLTVKLQPKLLTTLEEALWSGSAQLSSLKTHPSVQWTLGSIHEGALGRTVHSLPSTPLIMLFSLSRRCCPPPFAERGSTFACSPMRSQHWKENPIRKIHSIL